MNTILINAVTDSTIVKNTADTIKTVTNTVVTNNVFSDKSFVEAILVIGGIALLIIVILIVCKDKRKKEN